MKKGVSFVCVIMAIMICIGTMMTPAYADYEKPEVSFETKFEVLFDLYLEKEGIEDFVTVGSIVDIDGGHLVTIKVTEAGLADIKADEEIESDDIDVVWHLIVLNDKSYSTFAAIYVDGEFYDYADACGENILEDFDLI